MSTSRRKFLQDTSKTLAGATLVPTPLLSFAGNKKFSPNEKINIALIGVRSMGFGDLENALKIEGVTCTGLCDIDSNLLVKRAADVEKIQGTKPTTYSDYRKLLENKDLDAVIIGTPDHWHCLPFVAACEAGKDIYVEKPLANSIAECNVMVKVARKYQRVVQVGQQQRSGAHWKEAMNFMKAGNIGKLRRVNIWANFNYGTGPIRKSNEPVPAGVDYEMWLGPAPHRPFNSNHFHGSWRMFWDFGGGLLTDWGVHLFDMALWAKDIKTFPLAVQAAGGNFAFPDHAHETFDTMSVHYQLNDLIINWEHTAGTQTGPYGKSYGLAYVGDNATLVINRQGWELYPEWDDTKKAPKVPEMPKKSGGESHPEHMKNFIDCIKSRKDPNCTIENGRLVALYTHMGNISLRTNSRLEWDDAKQNFGKNKAANQLITPEYRKPWVLPRV